MGLIWFTEIAWNYLSCMSINHIYDIFLFRVFHVICDEGKVNIISLWLLCVDAIEEITRKFLSIQCHWSDNEGFKYVSLKCTSSQVSSIDQNTIVFKFLFISSYVSELATHCNSYNTFYYSSFVLIIAMF